MNKLSISRQMPLSKIITFFGLFSFFRPTIFERFVLTNSIFNGMLILSFVVCVADYVRRGNKFNHAFIYLASIFYIVMVLSTFVNHASISRALMYSLTGFFSIIFVEYILKYQFLYATKLMRLLLWLYIIVNILTVIIFPNGIVQTGNSSSAVFFLGQPTRYSYFYLPALLFCYLGDEYRVGHIRMNTIVIYFICLATLIASWTIGSSIAMLLLLVFLLFNRLKIFNSLLYYLGHIFAYFGLTYFSIQNLAAVFITGYLKKDLTLSSRTFIWNHAFDWISKSPLIGVGVLSNPDMINIFHFVHAHNHLLHITFQCGYIGLGIFLIMLLTAYLNLHKYKRFMPSKVIAFFIFMISIQLLVDTVDGVRNHYFFLIAMGANIGYIYEIFKNKKIKDVKI